MGRVTRRSIAAKEETPKESPKSGGRRGAKKDKPAGDDNSEGDSQDTPKRSGRLTVKEEQKDAPASTGRQAPKGRSTSRTGRGKKEEEPESKETEVETEEIEEEKPQRGSARSRGKAKAVQEVKTRSRQSTPRSGRGAKAVEEDEVDDDEEDESANKEEEEKESVENNVHVKGSSSRVRGKAAVSTPSSRGERKSRGKSTAENDNKMEEDSPESQEKDAEQSKIVDIESDTAPKGRQRRSIVNKETSEVTSSPGTGKGRNQKPTPKTSASGRSSRRSGGVAASTDETSENKDDATDQVDTGEEVETVAPKASQKEESSTAEKAAVTKEKSSAAEETVLEKGDSPATRKAAVEKEDSLAAVEKEDSPATEKAAVEKEDSTATEKAAVEKEDSTATEKEDSPAAETGAVKKQSQTTDSAAMDIEEQPAAEKVTLEKEESPTTEKAAVEMEHSQANENAAVEDEQSSGTEEKAAVELKESPVTEKAATEKDQSSTSDEVVKETSDAASLSKKRKLDADGDSESAKPTSPNKKRKLEGDDGSDAAKIARTYSGEPTQEDINKLEDVDSVSKDNTAPENTKKAAAVVETDSKPPSAVVDSLGQVNGPADSITAPGKNDVSAPVEVEASPKANNSSDTPHVTLAAVSQSQTCPDSNIDQPTESLPEPMEVEESPPLTNACSNNTEHITQPPSQNGTDVESADAHLTSSPDKSHLAVRKSYVPSSTAIDSRKYVSNPAFPVELMDPAYCFSVVSYNILADCHLCRGDYTYTQPQYLVQDYRHSLFLKELDYLDGDIICLQEVSPSYYTKTLLPAMKSRGYEGNFIKRSKEYWDEGEATFVRTSKFDIMSHQSVSLKDLAFKEVDNSGLGEDVSSAIKKYLDRSDVILLTELQCKKTTKRLTVCNIHVVHDLKAPDVQCIQVACAIKQLVTKAGSDLNPHLICGDFNSDVTSPVYQLARDGYLSDDHIRRLQALESLETTDGSSRSLIHHMWAAFQHTSSTLKNAYELALGKEPPVTMFTKTTKAVDHIFHSSASIDNVGVLETLDVEVMEASGGLPSKSIPSDHVSIKAVFRLK